MNELPHNNYTEKTKILVEKSGRQQHNQHNQMNKVKENYEFIHTEMGEGGVNGAECSLLVNLGKGHIEVLHTILL